MKCTESNISTIREHTFGVKRRNGKYILGLAHMEDEKQLNKRFEYYRKIWDEMAPGYPDWFYENQMDLFRTSVIKSASETRHI